MQHCKCSEHRFVIQRRDGTGERIFCKNILEVSRHIAKLRAVDPSVEAAQQYEIIEESSYYEPQGDQTC